MLFWDGVVAQLFEICWRHCATRSEVPVSMLVRALGNFQVTFFLFQFRSYGVHATFNRNEYYGICFWGKVRPACKLTTLQS